MYDPLLRLASLCINIVSVFHSLDDATIAIYFFSIPVVDQNLSCNFLIYMTSVGVGEFIPVS